MRSSTWDFVRNQTGESGGKMCGEPPVSMAKTKASSHLIPLNSRHLNEFCSDAARLAAILQFILEFGIQSKNLGIKHVDRPSRETISESHSSRYQSSSIHITWGPGYGLASTGDSRRVSSLDIWMCLNIQDLPPIYGHFNDKMLTTQWMEWGTQFSDKPMWFSKTKNYPLICSITPG